MGYAPQSRVIGGTFEFSFALPKAANRGSPNGRRTRNQHIPSVDRRTADWYPVPP